MNKFKLLQGDAIIEDPFYDLISSLKKRGLQLIQSHDLLHHFPGESVRNLITFKQEELDDQSTDVRDDGVLTISKTININDSTSLSLQSFKECGPYILSRCSRYKRHNLFIDEQKEQMRKMPNLPLIFQFDENVYLGFRYATNRTSLKEKPFFDALIITSISSSHFNQYWSHFPLKDEI